MKLLLGDSTAVLKTLDANSIDAVVTDPPYGLKFMNKHWDYDVPQVELWREVLRVLKPGGHLLSFGGTRTYHRMVVNIEDAGFEIRDQLQWIYGSGFPKSHNGPWGGTALKPANEPIVLARKPLEGTVAQNIERWGVGGLNIDASRIEVGERPHRERRNDKSLDGDVYGSGINDSRSLGTFNQGRWPANVMFDEEAAAMLDEQHTTAAVGYRKNPSTNKSTWFGAKDGSHIEGERGYQDSGGASRFFYVAKTSKRERNAGLEGLEGLEVHRYGAGIGQGKDPSAPTIDKNHHPTVKPIKLMQYLIKLITPPKGIVLDPFMGSGSTGCAAKSLGFDFIGIELEREYLEIALQRIEHWSEVD